MSALLTLHIPLTRLTDKTCRSCGMRPDHGSQATVCGHLICQECAFRGLPCCDMEDLQGTERRRAVVIGFDDSDLAQTEIVTAALTAARNRESDFDQFHTRRAEALRLKAYTKHLIEKADQAAAAVIESIRRRNRDLETRLDNQVAGERARHDAKSDGTRFRAGLEREVGRWKNEFRDVVEKDLGLHRGHWFCSHQGLKNLAFEALKTQSDPLMAQQSIRALNFLMEPIYARAEEQNRRISEFGWTLDISHRTTTIFDQRFSDEKLGEERSVEAFMGSVVVVKHGSLPSQPSAKRQRLDQDA